MTEMQRRVRFQDGDDLDPVRMMVRAGEVPLAPGTRIEVEIGARWGSNGHDRVGGIWVPCEVVADTSKDLVVKLLT